MSVAPEFSRAERVDTIGEGGRRVAIEAGEAERAALARRFGLLSVERLAADYDVRRITDGVLAEGWVAADVTQACSVTGDPIAARVDEPVRLVFAATVAPTAEEDLPEDALDTLPIEDGAIDLGEAAAETMALALDPFPRSPGAAAALREAGVLTEEEVRPATGLAGLKGLLEGR